MNPNIIGLVAVIVVIVALGLGIAGYMTAAWILVALNIALLIYSRMKLK